ncbi:MAG: class I SAM-dependent methyltransferase [Vicingaceae bacterium]
MLNEEIEKFIQTELNTPIAELSLKLSKKVDWPKQFIINQVNGRQKAKKKFPFLANFPNYIFPSPRAFAQASSEQTAAYKATLVKGDQMADLSGGMGIDTYFFDQKVKHLDFVERDEELFQISEKNFRLLGAKNVHAHKQEAESFLKEAKKYDFTYLDPDRRDESKRLFQIEDCSPNVLELIPVLFQKSKKVLVKLSPLLDIKLAIEQFKKVEAVHVVAVENDCKELLFILNPDYKAEAQIHCINFVQKEANKFAFNYSQEEQTTVNYSSVQQYLYEPNVAITKAGAFKSIAADFKLNKLAPNTHLYTSETLLNDFPGRVLKVTELTSPQKIKNKSANVVSKNFPLKAEQIRKKYKIKEGKNNFLYACGLWDNSKIFIWAERIP